MSQVSPKDPAPTNETPLQGWKEIAGYLKRDQRTARRWELIEGLPIRRLSSHRRSSVYAYPSEIEAWRTNRPSTAAAEQAEPQQPPTPRRLIPGLALAGMIVLAVLVIRFGPVLNPPSPIAQAAEGSVRTELVWPQAKGIYPAGSVSADGKFVTYVDWGDAGNLAIRNLETGENRRLTQTANWGAAFAHNSRISPDGGQVIYTWFRPSPAGETGELRLRQLGGDAKQARTVWSPADGLSVFLQDWFPDGDRVAAVVTKSPTEHQIVTVSVPDGEVRQIRSITWSDTPRARVSPDGRYIAYSRSASQDEPAKDIFLVAADGSSESAVVQHTANDELVGWSPNGDYLLINSDRNGQPGLWVQPLENTAPPGQLQLIVPNVDVAAGMGFAQDGSLYYSVRVSQRRLKLAEIDLQTGKFLAEPKNAVEQFVGRNLEGTFSPDGEEFAYLSGREGWNDRAIVVRSLATGEEREVPHDLRRVHYLIWPSGGDSLIVTGKDDRGRFGLFEVRLTDGHTELVTEGGHSAVLSPDGARRLHRIHPDRTIYSYGLADGSVETIPGVLNVVNSFSVLPDGRIAAIHNHKRTNSRTEIRLHPAEGGDGQVLWSTDEQHQFSHWTVWAPAGEALLVLRLEPEAGDGMWRLWAAPVDGSPPYPTELVYYPTGTSSLPSIHPDGRRILWQEGGYFWQVWAMRDLPFEAREQATE